MSVLSCIGECIGHTILHTGDKQQLEDIVQAVTNEAQVVSRGGSRIQGPAPLAIEQLKVYLLIVLKVMREIGHVSS